MPLYPYTVLTCRAKREACFKVFILFLYLCLNLLGGGRLSAVYLELVQLSGSLLVLHREFFLPHSKSTYLENISFLLCSQLRRCIHFLLLFQIQSNFLENIQPCFTSTVFSILWSILARIFFGLLTITVDKASSLPCYNQNFRFHFLTNNVYRTPRFCIRRWRWRHCIRTTKTYSSQAEKS